MKHNEDTVGISRNLKATINFASKHAEHGDMTHFASTDVIVTGGPT